MYEQTLVSITLKHNIKFKLTFNFEIRNNFLLINLKIVSQNSGLK